MVQNKELQLLADDIKGIIEDISFETSAEEQIEDGLRRSYVGIHRRSQTVDRSQRRLSISSYFFSKIAFFSSIVHISRSVSSKSFCNLLFKCKRLRTSFSLTSRAYSMEEKNAILEKKYDDMLKVYERIRENLKRCLTKVKDLECIGRLSSANNSDDESNHR
jgi:hypothetical protein